MLVEPEDDNDVVLSSRIFTGDLQIPKNDVTRQDGSERIGPISCGWDFGQDFSRYPSPLREFLFGWRRRAVDIAVSNAQGANSILWWPMYEDARPGDIVVFSLAPHRRFPIEATLGEYQDELDSAVEAARFVDADSERERISRTTYSSIIEEAAKYVQSPTLRRPLHPDFCDSEYPLACDGPAFQGVGVVTAKARSRPDMSSSDPNRHIAEGEVGHIVLFPRALSGVELARLVGDSTFGFELPDKHFWRPERPMVERSNDFSIYTVSDTNQEPPVIRAENQRWLTSASSGELLDALELSAELSDNQNFSVSIQSMRQTAQAYQRGEQPSQYFLPPEDYLGEPLDLV